jgi:hypothetical protein
MSLIRALTGADFVWVNGDIFRTDYIRMPDEDTVGDDVLIEGSSEQGFLMLTQGELQKAKEHEDGSFELRDGVVLRFLTSASVH